jgi:streptogramin lyase
VAGNGTQGFSGDGGPATGAQLNHPAGVAVDDAGNLYIADTGNFRIREVAADAGTITTIAGNGTQGDTGDGGPATEAELYAPVSLALDSLGNLYFSDSSAIGGPGADVREVAAGSGVITTVAGTGNSGYSGDGGPATAAQLNGPSGIAVDSAGDVYIADLGNHVIREVSAKTGIIQTVAGNGASGSTGDGGPANKASIVPLRIALDSQGNLYFANSIQSPTGSYNTVREVNVSAGWLNFAGTPVGTTSADSPQTATVLNVGNADMTLNVPSSGTNPAISNPSFTLDNGGTCPQLDTTSKSKALDSGDDCTLLFEFTPATSGAIAGTATVSDNALNHASSTQVIHLSGTGTGSGSGGNGGITGDFSLTATPPSETVHSGSTATYNVIASGSNGLRGP